MKLSAQKKKEAVLRVVENNEKIASVASEYGIARKTLYGWINRYKKDKDTGVKIFIPRYVRGEEHPKAKYPQIEEKLLRIISDNPLISINDLAKYVPVSLWTVWKILDKNNLNSKEERYKYSQDYKYKLYAQKKKEAVLSVTDKREAIAKVARRYGVARKTLYEWIERYKEEDSSMDVFEKRYVKGKDHPNAIYPEIEEDLLVLVANNPELSILDLAKNVKASAWTVWNLLDKYRLNTKDQRFSFARELIRRRQETVPVFSPETSFAFIEHRLQLLYAQTRKIPKLIEIELITPVKIYFIQILAQIIDLSSSYTDNISFFLLSFGRYLLNIPASLAVQSSSIIKSSLTRLNYVLYRYRLTSIIAREFNLFTDNLFAYFRTQPRYLAYYSFIIIIFILSPFIIRQANSYLYQLGLVSEKEILVTRKTDTDITGAVQYQEIDNLIRISESGLTLTGSSNYKINETPRFVIEKKTGFVQRTQGNISNVLGVRTDGVLEKPQVKIIDPKGSEVKGIELVKNNISEYELDVKEPEKLKPGEYTLEVIDDSGESMSQNFGWGMISINSNKSNYNLGDIVEFALSAIDSQGKTYCSAAMALLITNDQSGRETLLTVENGGVIVNPGCASNEKTLKPDYQALYKITEKGRHTVRLLAEIDNDIYPIFSQIFVTEPGERPDFEVVRVAPTRIGSGQEYPVVIRVTPNKDYQGQVIERLPGNFSVKPFSSGGTEIDSSSDLTPYTNFVNKAGTSEQQLIWDVDFKKDKTYVLSYSFSDMGSDWKGYYLGPLSIGDESQVDSGWELRQDPDMPAGSFIPTERYGSLKVEDKTLDLRDESIAITMPKVHFQTSENPTIKISDFEPEEQESSLNQGMFQRILGRSNQNIEGVRKDSKLNITVKDASGSIEYEAQIETKKASFEIPGKNLKPGKHTVTIMDNETGNIVEQDFLYGVLALNLNKTVFAKGETAYIQIASLDERGNTHCSGNLELSVFDPNGRIKTYKVEDKTISQSDTCGANNVTDNPDYFVYLPLNTLGEYRLVLVNLENGFSIEGEFSVEQKPEFFIERVGATRINPFRSAYTMKMNVSSLSNFTGTLVEKVPIDFEIKEGNYFDISSNGKQQLLRWRVNLMDAQTKEFAYEYQAPKVSPELYLIGPAQLQVSGKPVFSEKRQWQLASDAQFTRPDSDISTGNWTTTPLYSKIYESVASDAELIRSGNNPSNDAFEVGLSNVTDPVTSSGHIVRVRERMQQSGGGSQVTGSVLVALKQDSTTIASQTYTHAAGDLSWYDRSFTLTGTQADSITDYTSLRLNVSASKTGGTRTGWIEVSWAEFETPDPPPNEAPTLNIDEPDGFNDTIAQDGNFTVQYDLSDPDNTVTADFYYDTDNSGLDGVAISGCQDQDEGSDKECIWNTTGVSPGTYYVYGITSDGVNPQVSAYSSGVVTINARPTINIDEPDGEDDVIVQDGNFTVQYDLSDTDDTVTADFYYDTNNSGLDGVAISGCQDQDEGSDKECVWNTTGVTPGTYYVYGVTSDGVNSQQSAYSTGVVTINAKPTLNIDEPDGSNDTIAQDGNFTVQYDLSDPDNTVTANFYYDTNNSGLDGTAISGCQNQAEGTNQTCVWNTTSVSPGTYYVYGITSDGVNPQVSVYSTGVVTINARPTINIDEPDGTNDTIVQDGNFTVQYDLSDTDNTVTANFYYDTNNSGLDGVAIAGCQNQAEGTNQTCVWNTTGVTPGTYYVYGVTSDGINSQQSAYSTGVVTINARPVIEIIDPDGINDTIPEEDEYTVRYNLSDTDDTVTADFYYDTNNSGLDGVAISGCQDQDEGTNQTCIWDTTGVAPGNYYVYGITTDGFNSQVNAYSSGFVTITSADNEAPTLSIIQPDGVDDEIFVDANYTVEYDLSDPDDTVTADFYYDNDATGLDGTLIAGCEDQPEGEGESCIWDTTDVPAGTYYIYGVTSDGVNPQISTYSSGSVTINDAPELSIIQPDGVDDEIGQDTNFTVRYNLSDITDTVTADFYYDTNNSGLDGIAIAGCQERSEGTNQECTWNTTGVAPGEYYVYGITDDGFNPQVSAYSTGVVTINSRPTINIDEPDGEDDVIVQDGNFTVQYDLSDTDDTVTADFYYDTNNSGLDGYAISGCQDQDEGSDKECIWNTTGVSPGTYYVYGVTSDGVNSQQSAYSTGVVTINARPVIEIIDPDGINDTIPEEDEYTVRYNLSDTDDTVTADFYYDTNNSGLDGVAISGCQDQDEGTNQTCIWDTTGVAPGNYYVYGITTDGVNSQQSAYSEGYVTINAAPVIEIIQPDGVDDVVTQGDEFSVNYNLSDSDDTVTADYYYDDNATGLDGTLIAGCQDQPEGTNQSCIWDTTGVPAGTYYVYGITSDGINPEQSAYSSGVASIIEPPETFVIKIVGDTSWQVPGDWNNNDNKIEVIGGGGGGANGVSGTGATAGGGGGGGGGYSIVIDQELTPYEYVTISLGAGGTAGNPGGATYFNGSTCGTSTVCATGGGAGSGTSGGSGGSASVGTGFTGGTGGGGGAAANGGGGGGGGAGAGGLNTGGNNGSPGANSSANTGGTGGAGGQGDGTYGGTGGGGGTSNGGTGGNGGNGTEWDSTHGSGGGSGGGGGANRNGSAGSGGTSGLYGAGGGGGGGNASGGTGPGNGSSGREGLIVVTYTTTGNLAPNIHIYEPDGVDDIIEESGEFTIIYDLLDPEEVVTADFYYDIDNSGLDGTAIEDCQDQPEGTGESCVWDTTGVDPGEYYVYAIANDGVNPAQSHYSEGPLTINSQPSISNVSFNSGSDINLTADTTVNISFTATVTDPNTYSDITTVTGKAYRSGVTGGKNCTPDNNNCYQDLSCDLSNCSGNSCTATCTVAIAFFADATDGGTYASEYWLAWIEATDSLGAKGEGFSPSDLTDVNSLLTISTASTLSYGLVYPDNISDEKTVSVKNTGNRLIDLRIWGYDMCSDYPVCSQYVIPVGNQEFNSVSFTYGLGQPLSTSTYDLNMDIAKSSVVPSNSNKNTYWILGVPDTAMPVAYIGSNTIISIVSP